jgi:hypothetical protein
MAGPLPLDVPGWHVVEMSCVDGAGNEASLRVEVGVDVDGPIISATVGGDRLNQQWFGSEVQVRITALDLDSGMSATYVRLDGGEWLACDGTFQIAEAGHHVLECRGVDRAGNFGAGKAMEIDIDLLAPEVTFCGRPESVNLISLDGPELQLNGRDDVGGLVFFIRVDGGGWQSARGGTTRLAAGTHSIEAYAVDRAGRIGPIAAKTVVYDPEDPTAVLLIEGRSGDNCWYTGPVHLSVKASDAQPGQVTAVLRVNGRDVNPVGFLLDTPGWHEVIYMARDLAGNFFGPLTVHLGVDRQAPLLVPEMSGKQGANGWYTGDVALFVRALEDASGVQLFESNVDGTGWETTDGRIPIRHDGIHAVQVRCQDGAGNLAYLELEVPIDAGGPMLPYSDGQEICLKERSSALKFSMGDWCSGLSSVRVSIDKGEPLLLDVMTPTIALEQLSDGRHLMEIEAKDCAGNIASRTVTIDMNTDPLDPDGPYGILPLAAIVCLLAIAVAMIVRWGSRYR